MGSHTCTDRKNSRSMRLEKWLFDGWDGIDVGVVVKTLLAMEDLPSNKVARVEILEQSNINNILATVRHTHVVGHRYHGETLTH